jgi:hypothetical protein
MASANNAYTLSEIKKIPTLALPSLRTSMAVKSYLQ